jgi:hypothetical protein
MQSAANLANGQCGLSDVSTSGMWRLPTKDEWKAMIDKNYSDPVLSNKAGTGHWTGGDAFWGVQTSNYWSSTTDADNAGFAWGVNLGYGGVNYGFKTLTYYLWPVRGGH